MTKSTASVGILDSLTYAVLALVSLRISEEIPEEDKIRLLDLYINDVEILTTKLCTSFGIKIVDAGPSVVTLGITAYNIVKKSEQDGSDEMTTLLIDLADSLSGHAHAQAGDTTAIFYGLGDNQKMEKIFSIERQLKAACNKSIIF